MIATTRLLTLSTLLAVFCGLLLVHQAGAEGRFRPRGYSEEARQILKEQCRKNGGSSFQTDYHYSFGSDVPTSVTTTCHYPDGTSGPTCTITATRAQSCTILPADEDEPFGGPSGATVVEEFDTSSSSETANPAGDVLATPEADTAPRMVIVSTGRSTVVQAEDDDEQT